MSSGDNTLFLRLAGPMQSWGTSSRFQIRRTDAYPSKSGVFGLLLCAQGIRREDSARALESLADLTMGVRIDRCGTLDWDYHTAGAKIGIRSADGKIKMTAKTGEYETLLSHRQYLVDASFLVALHGSTDTISICANALNDPVWPIFLGRKCCVPAEPVFAGVGNFNNVEKALSSVPWQPRIEAIDCVFRSTTRKLPTIIEYPPGSPPPTEANIAYDVPRIFGYQDYSARLVVSGLMEVPVGDAVFSKVAIRSPREDPYGPKFKEARKERLIFDHHLCVFCKSPAVDVHHLDYEYVRPETLRSLCKLCHDACTRLEYGQDMHTQRIDPSDPAKRQAILDQITRLLKDRRLTRRRELLAATRMANDFFSDAPHFTSEEDH